MIICFVFQYPKALEQLIFEARSRSIATLGGTLFSRIYKLCSDFMNGSGAAEGDVKGDCDSEKLSRTSAAAFKNAKLLKVTSSTTSCSFHSNSPSYNF